MLQRFTIISRNWVPLALASIATVGLIPACDEATSQSADLDSTSGLPDMLEGGGGSEVATSPEPSEDPNSLEVEAPQTQIPTAAAYITGRASFKPDFHTLDFSTNPASGVSMDNSYVGRGRVPSADSSHSVLRYLFICAYEYDGNANDFQTNSEGDDDLLGCARADMFGRYSIPIEHTGQGADVYLVTSFCDNPQFSITVPSTSVTYDDVPEVCIRPNKQFSVSSEDLNEGGGDPEIKYLTSRMYANTLATTGETRISWNLSCPNQNGYKPSDPQYDPLICSGGSGDGALEPTETGVGSVFSVSWIGDKNSNFGHNKEFVHMYVSMVENLRWYGTYKPDVTNTIGGGGCSLSSCQDPIYVYACDTWQTFLPYVNPGVGSSDCGAVTKNAREIMMNHRCPGSGAPIGTCGDLNPHVVAHELGHVMQYRWGNTSSSSPVDTERYQTMEGWADFVALATWYEQDDADSPNADAPHFNDHGMVAENQFANTGDNWTENSCGSGNGCTCTEGNLDGIAKGEARAAMFFWDLYDTGPDGGFDTVSEDFDFIRMHWSAMGNLNNDDDLYDDHESKECLTFPEDLCPGDDGVNLEDFRWWWNELQPLTSAPSITTVMQLNCTDKHVDGLGCTTGGSTCDPYP